VSFNPALDEIVRVLLDPGKVMTHVPYALLVISMLMRDMGWLRAIAIAAGIIRIVNRAWFDQDFIVVFWESIFVAVNVAQLLVLLWYERRARFSDEEKVLVAQLDADIDRRTVRRLIKLGQWRQAETDDTFIEEDKPVKELIFLVDGLAQIERSGAIVAVCGPGDFLGEMSFVTGRPANATVRAARPLRYLAFEQSLLRRAMDNDRDLRRAVESGLNRNLVGKLARANAAHPARI